MSTGDYIVKQIEKGFEEKKINIKVRKLADNINLFRIN